jgi:very-short-patch-repair endonuclease
VGNTGRIWGKISQAEIGALAARQYGHVTRDQLLGLGLGRRAISHRIDAGNLIAVHAGVYAVGHEQTAAVARAAAAILACGPGAALSHSSAASLWGISKRWEFPLEVTVPGDRRRQGIRIHRSTTLTGKDIRRHLGIRVMSPARTVLEIAPRLTEPVLTRAVNDARLSRQLRLTELDELLERMPRHPGAPLLKQFVNTRQAPTRSGWEDELTGFLERFDLPKARINTRVAGYEVDAVFDDERLIVELDGWETHQDRTSFENDRERDAATLAAGFVTVRVTWDRFHNDPAREAARLQEILHARRQSG